MSTKKKQRGAIEIRKNDDGTLDEVVGKGVDLLHVEQMASDYWWMSISRGRKRWTLHFYTGTGDDTGAPITLRVEDESR